MRKLLPSLVSAASIAIAVAGLAGPTSAQPYGMMGGGYGLGMMGGYAPGMTGGYGPGYGMMGGYGCCGMMGGGYGPGYGTRGGYGPGMMGGYGHYGMMGGGYGPGPMMGGYGSGYYGGQPNLNLTTENVKNYLERMIAVGGNAHLKVGDVKEKDADIIVADIVTKDKDALVQRFVVDRHSGFYRPEENQ